MQNLGGKQSALWAIGKISIKTDNFTSCKKNVDAHGRLWTAQGRMG